MENCKISIEGCFDVVLDTTKKIIGLKAMKCQPKMKTFLCSRSMRKNDDNEGTNVASLKSLLVRRSFMVVFINGHVSERNPDCYNGSFRDKELYWKLFSEKRDNFLRWRVTFHEKNIRGLNFDPGVVSRIFQVNDLKNYPGPHSWELRKATNRALQLLQDNYPEFVANHVFTNVSWWYVSLSKMMSLLLTKCSKRKNFLEVPSRSMEAILKYISAEKFPRQCDIMIIEGGACSMGWEAKIVCYSVELAPSEDDVFTVIIQNASLWVGQAS